MLGIAWFFAALGVLLGVVIEQAATSPLAVAAIATAATAAIAIPVTVSTALVPGLRPILDLAAATERVGAGDFTQRVPVVQDDDLGVLSASFNRMQAGLLQRARLQAAFGSYVDPVLAERLLAEGSDIFAGERREVTVMFVDIRDFTLFAEANSAEDTVARLNAVFDIVVPVVVQAGGHVNKYLGDGAMAVFGAPNLLADHADAALTAAVEIDRLVAKRFDGAVRIGIGLNTGAVIAGTIGGGGRHEFTVIGDAVNVAARVEQLTKQTGDAILLTEECFRAIERDLELADRGHHDLKGKRAPVRLYAAHSTPPGP